MKTNIKFGLLLVALLLCTCGTKTIDESSAAAVAKKALSLFEPITAQPLKGGHSGAKLFTIKTDSKTYVVRFLTHKSREKREQEIHDLRAASQAGYAPHVFYVDPAEGVVIMEYLVHIPITAAQRHSEQLYKSLAHLLYKIHHGPRFQKNHARGAVIKRLLKKIAKLKACQAQGVHLAQLEQMLEKINQAISSHVTMAPCHNDLTPRNLIFCGNAFKTIDFEDAAQSDPYFDVAMVILFNCINSLYENVLFKTYLGHQPTAQESAKLYLIKQIVLVDYAVRSLHSVSHILSNYGTLPVAHYDDWYAFLNHFLQEKAAGGLKNIEYNLEFAKIIINRVMSNFASKQFSEAVALLHSH